MSIMIYKVRSARYSLQASALPTSAVQRIMVAAPNPGSVKVEQKLATIVLLQWARGFSRKTVTALDGGGDMQNKKRDPKRWVILALVNVLVILYPVSLYCQAGDDQSTLVGACALVGAAFLLAMGIC